MLYSGDTPNLYLRSFVQDHLEAGLRDPSGEDYRVPPFTRPIQTTKNSPIFSMHGYHLGKKPHDAVEAYIKHFTREDDLVLDPFCGSGSTALAALMHGRKAVALDISPAATFITRFYVVRCDPEDLARRFEKMCSVVAPEMDWLYRSVCHRCGGPAMIHYLIYSNVYQCPDCARHVSFFEASQQRPPCCPMCMSRGGERHLIRPSLPIVGYDPVATNFSCLGSCRPRRCTRSIVGTPEERRAFRDIDIARIHEIESKPIPYSYPQHRMMNVADVSMPWGDEWRPSRDFRRVADLFTYRNLWAVAAFMNAAGNNDDLRAVITSGMLAVSRKAQHLDAGGGYIPGNWALPPVSKQRNVLESLGNVFRRTLKAKKRLATLVRSQNVCISTQSATSMGQIPDCSVDYIFTDPPYGGTVQYGELNFVWEAWLGFDTSWHDQEITVNHARNRGSQDWQRMMQSAMAECYRVLKAGRWLSLCWHDAAGGTWPLVQKIMAAVGFVVGDSDSALTIDTGSHTYNQRVTDKVVKRDLVINFQKPRRGESPETIRTEGAPHVSFDEQALAVLRAYVNANPGSTKDRVYDHFISVMMRIGRLEGHNFEKLLAKVARRGRGTRQWYPK